MNTGNQKLGVDLAGLDLQITYQGDLAVVDGLANVRAAVLRRLNTPIGGLFSHPTYGNPVHDLLSEPMDDSWSGRVLAGIRQCLQREPRITLLETSLTIEMEARKAVILIQYSVLDNPGQENLVWEVDLP